MGHVLAADQCFGGMDAVHQRQLERVRRLRLDVRFGRAMGLGLLPLRTVGEGGHWMRLGLGARHSVGAIVGIMASGQGEYFL